MKEKDVVWVTGASSGLGMHTARALARAGFQVVAGARSFAGRTGLAEDGCHRLSLDVTSGESMDAFCREARALCGEPDALVNCAGYLIWGAAEEYSASELRGVMETNFIGMAGMISRVLPAMRARGRGRIVNFSSVNGLMGTPFQGAYAASKHAVEGYSECLSMEVKPFGVQVCLVEPGDHRSGAARYRLRGGREDSPYAARRARAIAVMRRDEENGADPARLGEKVARALQKKRLPARFCVAKADQRLAVALHKLLPARLVEMILASYYSVR